MWEILSIVSALVINDEPIRSFPFQYFEGEVLTDDQVKYRFRIIYINYLMFTTVIFSSFPALGPIIQIELPVLLFPVSIERLM